MRGQDQGPLWTESLPGPARAQEGTWQSRSEPGEDMMTSPSEQEPKGMFECQLCGLTAPYSYVGQKPPNTHTVVLLEECHVLKDPFTLDKDKFLILGSPCSLCNKLVCVGQECSLYYSKRFCLPCVHENLSAFPQEIQQEVEKRRAPSKAASKKSDSRTLL